MEDKKEILELVDDNGMVELVHNNDVVELLVNLVGHIAWPITVAIIVILFRKQIQDFFRDIRNIKVGDIVVKMEHMEEKLDSVEAATKNLSIDLYRVSGDALRVREEIWSYIAEILRKASPDTRYEMAAELNKYHLPRLGVKASEVKSLLNKLGYYDAEDPGSFSEEITKEFVTSVFNYQDAENFEYSDGIVGPATLSMLRRNLAEKTVAQQGNVADS